VPITIIDNPPEDSRVVREEAFGPILPLLKFDNIDDVISRANDTDYGLAASVWGKDIAAARAVAERIEAGTVWVNEIHSFSRSNIFPPFRRACGSSAVLMRFMIMISAALRVMLSASFLSTPMPCSAEIDPRN